MPPPRKPPRALPRHPPGEVRLIGGLWKRSKLPVPDKPGLRPSPDRVRETLFNWLGQDLAGWRCLDAFAGTGALGFEAASRGAAEVMLLERDRDLAAQLEATRVRLGGSQVRVECTDALGWMRGCAPGRFDLVLLDPPFDAGLGSQALDAAARLVPDGGFVYLEAASPVEDPPATLGLWRHGRAGAVHYHLLRRGYTAAVHSPG